MAPSQENLDENVVSGFGDEWARFDQSALTDDELRTMFESYFGIFPWSALAPDAHGFDAGCGTGRWAKFVAPRVGRLICVDASEGALSVARRNLAGEPSAEFRLASVAALPFPDSSMDFGYSLGVLHHVPDTPAAVAACVSKLKPGAPFLLYLYYSFDNRPAWYRTVWRTSELMRRMVSRLPHGLRFGVSQVLAATVYWPLARAALVLEKRGRNVQNFPLAFYRNRSFYVMRNDALDRFGTRLEQRFSRAEVERMMTDAGLERIVFSDTPPFWTAVGWKAR